MSSVHPEPLLTKQFCITITGIYTSCKKKHLKMYKEGFRVTRKSTETSKD